MDSFLRDLRQAFRSFRANPALVAVATLSLSLGIAINVTVFAGIDFVILRPYHFPRQDRLIHVWSTNPARGWNRTSPSLPDLFDWRDEATTVDLAGFRDESYNLAGGERPERIAAALVTGDFFSIFAATPKLGRLIGRGDEAEGNQRIAVISERLWRDRFDSDSSVIGHSIRLDDEPYAIVGVLPASFRVPRLRSDVWIAAANTPFTRRAAVRGEHTYQVVGLLRPGSTLASAQAELAAIAARLAGRYPESNQGLTVRVITFYDRVVDPTSQRGASISLIAVGLVLLIACANVANLLLTRNTARRRELAIRLAVGARPSRLVRQLLTESLALALIGGIAGVLLSFAGIAWFRSILPADVPGADAVAISGRTLLFALGATIAAGLAFGLAPAVKASAPGLAGTLVDGGRTGTTSVRAGRWRNALVVSELALALVLLISAGLLIRAAAGLQRIDLGFDPLGVLTFRTALSEKEYPDSARVVGFEDQLRDRLRAMTGVQAVGAVTELPMSSATATYYTVVGEPDRGQASWPIAQSRGITPGYLTVMRIGIVRGRDLTEADRPDATPVALVSEAFARRHWPTGNPVGQRLRFQSGRTREIVGVVHDTREFGPEDPPPPIIYVPLAQETYRGITVAVRSGGDPVALADGVRQVVRELAPHQPIYQVATLAAHVDFEIRHQLIMARLLTSFGGAALFLAMMGVYGVMGYSVARRTQELGVRRALGAETAEIVRLVAWEGARLTGLGTAIGLALALGSTRALSSFLYGVSALDPAVFLGVSATLIVASFLATVVPAKRATAVDPAVALRNE